MNQTGDRHQPGVGPPPHLHRPPRATRRTIARMDPALLRTLRTPLAGGLLLLCACASPPPTTTPPPTPPAALPSIKPVATAEFMAAAEPQLEAYLRRVLGGDGANRREVELVEARLFSEGHINETWRITVDVDGEINHAALKIFASPESAATNAAMFKLAQESGWPVPTELVRGDTQPYSPRESLLMQFMVGGSLRQHVAALFRSPEANAPTDNEVADLYAEVGDVLGYLHKSHMRPRRRSDTLDRPAMDAALGRCSKGGWCDATARQRLLGLAEELDKGPVTFCHGDLYESQIIMGEDERVRAFIDLDAAGYGDPAKDVGQLLAHVLLVNPVAREAGWKIPSPSTEEAELTARQVLLAYRASAGLADTDWAAFYRRVRAHAWLRMAKILFRYRGNPHARAMVEGLEAHKARFTAEDPFKRLDIR